MVQALGATACVAPLGGARAQPVGRRSIKIGVINDMSGVFRDSSGETSVACTRQAIEDFGDHGFAVELLVADHQNKPDVGSAIARKWFSQDGVDMIIDVPGSAIALAINTVAKEANRTYIVTGSGTTDLTQSQCTPVTLHWSYSTAMLTKSTVGAIVKSSKEPWFFVTADYLLGRQLQADATAIVLGAGAKVLGSALYPFPSTTDFSSYLIQAQSSGAKFLGLAMAGDDVVNAVKQATEFGLTKSGMSIVLILSTITGIHSIGLETAQGLLLTESFYWDLNDRTRSLMNRLKPKTPNNYPNEDHIGCYSGTLHFLKSVAALGVDRAADGAAVVSHMKSNPIDDDAFGHASIRWDGHVMLPAYLMRAKKPTESTGPWDLFDVVSTMPAEAVAPDTIGCTLPH